MAGRDMRFMVMVKATKDSENGVPPDAKLLEAMGKFNEELVKAGVMLDAAGLQPSSKGARVRFSGTKRTVIDGPVRQFFEMGDFEMSPAAQASHDAVAKGLQKS